MNCPSARSSRANCPVSTVKRLPDSRAARSKSISPSNSPISKCSLAQFGRGGTRPTLRSSRLSCSSLPTGTSSSGRFGTTAAKSRSSRSRRRSSASAPARNALISLTSAFSRSAVAASPARIALPISREAALRRSWRSCSLPRCARRASSSDSSPSTADRASDADHCRFTSAATTFSGFSRIHLISSMGKGFHTNRAIRKHPLRGEG
jgi:hypothetical protein